MIRIHFTGSFRSEDFSKKNKNHASKAIQFIYCRKNDLFFRSNILPERKRDGTLGRCSIYRLYNSTSNNFAAGYQSTRSFVKLGNSSNTTEAPPIFVVAHVFFCFSFGRNLEKISSRLSRSKHKMESRGSFRTETPFGPDQKVFFSKQLLLYLLVSSFQTQKCPKKNKNKTHKKSFTGNFSRYLCF